MTICRTEKMRLKIADEVRNQFVFAHDEWGYAIAYSADTLIVYDHNDGVKQSAISPNKFKWLVGKSYILDGFLYYSAYKLGRMDAGRILGYTSFYAWDQDTVYYLNGPVKGANPVTFQHLLEYWARDDQKCFYQNRPIPGADAGTFRAINDSFAVDKNNVYISGGRVAAKYEADPVDLGRGYFVVSGKLFCFGEEIPGADLQTFKVLPKIEPNAGSGASPADAGSSKQKPGGTQSMLGSFLKRGFFGMKRDTGVFPDTEAALAAAGFTAYDSRWKYRNSWHAPLK